jgi:hypothetical protein
MSDLEDTGAIDWLLLEGPGTEMNGALVPPLLDLVDRRLIRILDVLVLVKRSGDDFDALTTADLDPAKVGDLGALDGASSGLLSADDAATAASLLSDGSLGLLVVYENLWSLPFAAAARAAGGQLVANGHIPTQAILAQLDILEA